MTEPTEQPKPEAEQRLTPDGRHIVEWVEWQKGRTLTPEEISLSLDQARDLGAP
jgi:hypothetical protein